MSKQNAIFVQSAIKSNLIVKLIYERNIAYVSILGGLHRRKIRNFPSRFISNVRTSTEDEKSLFSYMDCPGRYKTLNPFRIQGADAAFQRGQ